MKAFENPIPELFWLFSAFIFAVINKDLHITPFFFFLYTISFDFNFCILLLVIKAEFSLQMITNYVSPVYLIIPLNLWRLIDSRRLLFFFINKLLNFNILLAFFHHSRSISGFKRRSTDHILWNIIFMLNLFNYSRSINDLRRRDIIQALRNSWIHRTLTLLRLLLIPRAAPS